jgi:alkylation response protein AidB-like acyl-CoA dehydrogenase
MDCAVVFEALGHGPVPGPLFTSGVLSAQMIFEACTEEQRKALLPKISDGSSIVVPAITDKAAYWGPEAVETSLSKTPAGYIMNGVKRFVSTPKRRRASSALRARKKAKSFFYSSTPKMPA